MKTMELPEVQIFLKKLLEKVAHPRIGTVIGLQEEIGKLAKIVMNVDIYGYPLNRNELENGCADVFLAILDVCNAYGVDIAKASEKKIEAIKSKINQWEKAHGRTLQLRREKFDRSTNE